MLRTKAEAYSSPINPAINPAPTCAEQGAQKHEYDKAKEERNRAEKTFELLRDEKQRIDREWDLYRQRMEPEGVPTGTTHSRIGSPLISGGFVGGLETVKVIRPSRTSLSGTWTPTRTPRSPQRSRIQPEPERVKTNPTPENPEYQTLLQHQYALRDRMRVLTRKLESAAEELEQKEKELADKRQQITQAESAYTDAADTALRPPSEQKAETNSI